MTGEIIGIIIAVAAVAFNIGGMFGFGLCAILIASKDEKEGKK